ncbi:glycosyltransferase [Duganella callida]|uniref:Glycosyl transferase family 1 n=1 Tax=Duganella callida TaxID=2561932 RepID=A0A4Y9SBJ8_9BURK|nr:glycosyltransferase [Duganella callida]TFW19283.1 glycosyl transferase family 1 [Duganella callida]
MQTQKILFYAEAVTLAHVARLLALAQTMDRGRYALHFACADGYEFCFRDTDYTRWRVDSISSQQFLGALAAGQPVYDEATLSRYVEADRQLLAQVRPDVVVGDFRLSLSVSARLAQVPYIALSNAYWSPYVDVRYTVPSLPMTRVLPIALADPLFRLAQPLAFALHARPLNRVRRKYGLPSLGPDLRRIYTDADHTAYMDVPELFPAHDLPAHHSYLGPVMWAPPIAPPDWWTTLPDERATVYVTLGSSGQGRLLPLVLDALAPLPVQVLAATAGNIRLDHVPDNARVADYLPGDAAARRAALVICNGGSPTSQQALAAGVPVLGIAGNLDQFLNMQALVRAGAGRLLRADRLSAAAVQAAATAMLDQPPYARAAQEIAGVFAQTAPGLSLERLIGQLARPPR